MEKTREVELVDIFRQFTPENQAYFMSIIRVAEAAEMNGKKAGVRVGSEKH